MPTIVPDPINAATPPDNELVLNIPTEIRALKARVNAAVGLTPDTANYFRRNLLDNGTFQLSQRRRNDIDNVSTLYAVGAKFFAVDRWPFYNAGAADFTAAIQAQLAPDSAGIAGRTYSLGTATGSINARIGNYQRVMNVRRLKGRILTLTLKLTIPSTIIAAGSTDVDVILNYGTGGTPAAQATLLASIQVTATEATAQVFSWTFAVPNDPDSSYGTADDAYIQVRLIHPFVTGASVYWHGAQLEEGAAATPFEYVTYTEELAKCAAHFQTSYPRGVHIGAANNTGCSSFMAQGTGSGVFHSVHFPYAMYRTPNMTLYSSFNANAPGKVYKETTTAGDVANTSSAARISNRGFGVVTLGAAAIANHEYTFQWIADAENY